MPVMNDPTSHDGPRQFKLAFRARRGRSYALRLLSLFLVLPFALAAQESEAAPARNGGLFDSDKTLEVILRLPWQAIVTDEFFYQGGYPSVLELTDGRGQSVSIPVQTERRGWSRQVICRNPPLKLRFDQKDVKGTLFEGQKSLKLVTHCNNGADFEQYQVLESLAYRMYNLVSDYSFRVRPLSVTYADTDTGKSDGPRFAFLIEDDSDVAKRNGQKKLKVPTIRPDRLEAEEASKLWLFEYMIGNTAWSLEPKEDETECCNNLQLIGDDPESDPVYAAPNDFDASGLVNAHYSKPAEELGIDSVTERKYLGFCVDNSTLGEARSLYIEKQGRLLAMVESDDYLHEDTKKQTVAFLDQFFETLKDPRQFQRQILSKCRD